MRTCHAGCAAYLYFLTCLGLVRQRSGSIGASYSSKGVPPLHQVDLARIARALCVHANGPNVVIDDDVVRELAEGQDMVVEFSELPNNRFVGIPALPIY